MKIAILGAGNVGSTLGSGWAKHGHDVSFGVRNPKKTDSATTTKVVTVMEAAQSADIVVLAVPWKAVEDALQSAGHLAGKIVLDATNPLLPDLSGLDVPPGTSAAEKIASLTKATVVKIFNTTGYPNMANPDYHGEKATMFYCGDDVNAKRIAADLARELGFDPVDAGPLKHANLLEQLAVLWITLAFQQGYGVNFAFRMMRR